MKKKWIISLLIGSMVLSFTGCGNSDLGESDKDYVENDTEGSTVAEDEVTTGEEVTVGDAITTENEAAVEDEVTAESLLDMMNDYMDVTIISDALYDLDMESTVSDDSMEMNSLKMKINLSMKTDSKISYAEGNTSIEYSGMENTIPVERYDVTEEDGSVTTYSMSDGVWVKEKDSSRQFNVSVGSFKNDAIKDLKLDESGEEYIVTGNINWGDIEEGVLDSTENFSNNTELDDSSLAKITYVFDKSTKRLKEYTCDFAEAFSEAMENIKVNKCVVSITITDYSSDSVEIPENVIENAIESAPDVTK